MTAPSEIHHVSDTAFWVATYRARETAREDALFRDPLAQVLLDDRGERIAQSMRKTSRYTEWTLVTRTVLIDELLLHYIAQGHKTVINLGAGLDTRPSRLDLPAEVQWIEIDFPAMIGYKNKTLAAERPRCRLERLALDLTDREARRKALRELNARTGPVVILTEGVIPYLTPETVTELAEDLHSLENSALWIADYHSRKLYKRFQSPAFVKRMGGSPFRFYPDDYFALFAKAGWRRKEMRYLYDVGVQVGRPFPLPWFARPFALFAKPEKLAALLRLQGFVVFEKA